MTRYAVSLDLVNLTEAERNAVHAFVAVMADPGLQRLREQFAAGQVALVVEEGEVTWPNTRALRAEEVAP